MGWVANLFHGYEKSFLFFIFTTVSGISEIA